MGFHFGIMFGSTLLIQSHNYVCNVMHCVWILLIGYLLCKKPYRFELFGLAVTLLGLALMFSDPEAERSDGKSGELWVYAVCIGCSLSAAFYLMINAVVAETVPIFTSISIQAFVGSIYSIIVNYATNWENYELFSMNAMTGGFGMLNPD